MIKLSSHMFGYFFQANSYIGVNEKGEAFAVDIGGEAERFLKYLEENDLKLKMILLTHGHFDHIRGVAEVAENTGAKVYIHSEDASMLTDPEASLARFVGGTEFKAWNDFTEVKDGNVIDFDGTAIKVIHTPGHTKGSVCYVYDDVILSGDTLFRGSVGRTDFPGGSHSEILKSLDKLSALADNGDYKVYPGHNEETTLSDEMKYNPYFG